MIKPFAMFPVLVANNLASLKAFYETRFGFESEFFQEDFYLHLAHKESGVQLAFMVPNHPSQPKFLHQLAGTHGMVISLEVADAKAAFSDAEAAAMDFVMDYKEEEFGVNHFMVRDPGGFVVDVVEHRSN